MSASSESAGLPAAEAPSGRLTVPRWAWAAAAVAMFLLYLLLQDNGTVLAQAGSYVHEFAHDGRHAFGVPCH